MPASTLAQTIALKYSIDVAEVDRILHADDDCGTGWEGQKGHCVRSKVAHGAEHLTESAAGWAVGKFVGGAIAQVAASHGFPPVAAHLLSETAVQAIAATLIHARKAENRNPTDLAAKFITEAAAGFIGKSGHSGAHAAMEHIEGSAHAEAFGALIAGKAGGISTATAVSGIAHSIAGRLTNQSKALHALVTARVPLSRTDADSGTTDQLTTQKRSALFDLTMAGWAIARHLKTSPKTDAMATATQPLTDRLSLAQLIGEELQSPGLYGAPIRIRKFNVEGKTVTGEFVGTEDGRSYSFTYDNGKVSYQPAVAKLDSESVNQFTVRWDSHTEALEAKVSNPVRLDGTDKRLKCGTATYQCGGICQGVHRGCHKNEAAAVDHGRINKINALIEHLNQGGEHPLKGLDKPDAAKLQGVANQIQSTRDLRAANLVAGRAGDRMAKAQPKQEPGESLGQLFTEADRVGSKYQTSEEIKAHQQKMAKAVSEVGGLIDKQFPDDGGSSADYGKSKAAPSMMGKAPGKSYLPSTVSRFLQPKPASSLTTPITTPIVSPQAKTNGARTVGQGVKDYATTAHGIKREQEMRGVVAVKEHQVLERLKQQGYSDRELEAVRQATEGHVLKVNEKGSRLIQAPEESTLKGLYANKEPLIPIVSPQAEAARLAVMGHAKVPVDPVRAIVQQKNNERLNNNAYLRGMGDRVQQRQTAEAAKLGLHLRSKPGGSYEMHLPGETGKGKHFENKAAVEDFLLDHEGKQQEAQQKVRAGNQQKALPGAAVEKRRLGKGGAVEAAQNSIKEAAISTGKAAVAQREFMGSAMQMAKEGTQTATLESEVAKRHAANVQALQGRKEEAGRSAIGASQDVSKARQGIEPFPRSHVQRLANTPVGNLSDEEAQDMLEAPYRSGLFAPPHHIVEKLRPALKAHFGGASAEPKAFELKSPQDIKAMTPTEHKKYLEDFRAYTQSQKFKDQQAKGSSDYKKFSAETRSKQRQEKLAPQARSRTAADLGDKGKHRHVSIDSVAGAIERLRDRGVRIDAKDAVEMLKGAENCGCDECKVKRVNKRKEMVTA